MGRCSVRTFGRCDPRTDRRLWRGPAPVQPANRPSFWRDRDWDRPVPDPVCGGARAEELTER